MRHWLTALFLLSAPALAQAGDLALSPTNLGVANSQQSSEIILTYRPGSPATDMEATVWIALDRIGWAQVERVAPASSGYETWCQVVDGSVRAIVVSRTLGNLPADAAIPVCRLRVRPHAGTPRGRYRINIANPYEWAGEGYYPVTTNSVLVVVP